MFWDKRFCPLCPHLSDIPVKVGPVFPLAKHVCVGVKPQGDCSAQERIHSLYSCSRWTFKSLDLLGLCFPAQMLDHLDYSAWRRVTVMTGNVGIFQIGGIFKYVSSVFHTCLLLKICVVPVWSCKFRVSNIVNKLISLSFQPACFWCREMTFFPYFTVKNIYI